MPQRYSGVKELRKNKKRRLHTLDIKTDIKKTIKKFREAVQAKNKADADKNLQSVYKKLDKAAKRNIIPPNRVARRKSYYAKQLASISG